MIFLDELISFLDMVSFKGRLASEHSVEDDSQRPDIHFIGMSFSSLKNLRRDVVWCPTDSAFSLALELKLSSESKISNLDLHSRSKEEVS